MIDIWEYMGVVHSHGGTPIAGWFFFVGKSMGKSHRSIHGCIETARSFPPTPVGGIRGLHLTPARPHGAPKQGL